MIRSKANSKARSKRPRSHKAAKSPSRQARRAPETSHHGPLTQISIRGFRGIRELEVDGLAPLTVFTGDNGAGKSTLLEAVFAVYGRTTPVWIPGAQARRGFARVSRQGPSYLGLFYGLSEEGQAKISARAEDGSAFRLEIQRTTVGPHAVILEPNSGGSFNQSDLADAVRAAPVEFRAFRDDVEENKSSLEWTFTPPNRWEMQARGAKPGRLPAAFLLSGEDFDEGDSGRFGDVREAGRDTDVIDVLRTIDPRVEQIEYLETSKAQYFRATLQDGRALPLGMLGGGLVTAFRHALALAFVERGLVAIDEVGAGIHYRRLPDYFRGLLTPCKRLGAQLVLTTHSFEALVALVHAATELDPDRFAVVHLRRDDKDQVRATVIPGEKARSAVDHGYDLR